MPLIQSAKKAMLAVYDRFGGLTHASKPKVPAKLPTHVGEPVANEVVVSIPIGQNRGKLPEYDVRLYIDEGYRRNVIAHACISVLATAASEPEIKIRTIGDDPTDVPETHPLAELLKSPNETESMKELIERLLIDINAAGYAYIHKGRNSAGQVIRLQRLRPDYVLPIPGDNIGEILGYEFRPGNGARDQIIQHNDLIRIALSDPLDDHAGLSPLMVAANFINIHSEAGKYLQDYFLNGAVPAGFIVIKSGPVDPDERERVMSNFAETYGTGSTGSRTRGNRHRWGVVGGDVDFKQMSTDLDKLNLDEVWGITEANICSAFRVPAILVQAKIGLQRNTYSSHSEARRSLWEDTLPPQFNRIKWALQRGLIVSESNEPIEIYFDLTKVTALQESEDLRIERAAKKYTAGLITRNEGRILAGDPKLDEDYIVIPTGAIKVDEKGVSIPPESPEPGSITPDGRLVPNLPPPPGSEEEAKAKEAEAKKESASTKPHVVVEVRAKGDRESHSAPRFPGTPGPEGDGDVERHGARPEDPRVYEISKRIEEAFKAAQNSVDVSALEVALALGDASRVMKIISEANAETIYSVALSGVVSRVVEQVGYGEYSNREVLGEGPGHAFRGNQHTGGIGGSGSTAPGTKARDANLKKWFGASKVVDSDGKPLVVYHGTASTFNTFDPNKANVESDMGAGFYFSSEQDDVGANYAGEGPDLSQRIEMRAERIAQDLVDDYDDEEDPKLKAEAYKRARAELSVEHGGAALPVYLKIENPAVFGGDDETFLDYEEEHEDGEPTGEASGKLVDFVDAIRSEASNFNDGDVDDFLSSVMEEAYDGGLKLGDIHEKWKSSEQTAYFTNDNGDNAQSEVFRRALKRIGFDGIIDRTVDKKFGSQRRIGKQMEGMDYNTVHYIAFKSNQIKSAIGNKGTFDPFDDDIRHGEGPGHAFRGNQHTGGIGGSGVSKKPWEMSPEEYYRSAERSSGGSLVALYRGDAKQVDAYDTDLTSENSLFGQGIYLTNSPRVASDYEVKGNQEIAFRYQGGKGGKLSDAIDAYIRTEARYMNADGTMMTGMDLIAGRELPSMVDDPERVARLAAAKKKWEQVDSKGLKIRKGIDGLITFIPKEKPSTRSGFLISKEVLDRTIDAEDEIPDEITYALPRSVRSFAESEDDSGFRPTFREVWQQWKPEEEEQKKFREALSEDGYTGVSYAGGLTMGGGVKHKAYSIWDSSVVNAGRGAHRAMIRKAIQSGDLPLATARKLGHFKLYPDLAEKFHWTERHGEGPGHPFRGNQHTGGKSFSEWFGNSKVVDKSGAPMVVYHGSTSRGVEEFEPRVTDRTAAGDARGVYFTSDQMSAFNYTTRRGPDGKRLPAKGEIVPAYLKIENPLNTTSEIKRLQKKGMSFGDAKREALKALRPEHDGIIFDGDNANPNEFVVFRSEQIKSATKNSGAFDPADKRITHGEGPGHAFRGNQHTGGISGLGKGSGSPAHWNLADATEEQISVMAEEARSYTDVARELHGVPVTMFPLGQGLPNRVRDIIEAQMHAGILELPSYTRSMMKNEGWVVSVGEELDDMNGGMTLGYVDAMQKKVAMSRDGVLGSAGFGQFMPGYVGDKLPRLGQPLYQHELGHVEIESLNHALLSAVANNDFDSANEISDAVSDFGYELLEGGSSSRMPISSYAGKFLDKGVKSMAGAPLQVMDGDKILHQSSINHFIHEGFAEMHSAIEGRTFEHKDKPKLGQAGFNVTRKEFEGHVKAYSALRSILGSLTKKSAKWKPATLKVGGPAPSSSLLGMKKYKASPESAIHWPQNQSRGPR